MSALLAAEVYRAMFAQGLIEKCAAIGGETARRSESFPNGGQELLLFEIAAAARGCGAKRAWLPFSIGPLARVVYEMGIRVDFTPWYAPSGFCFDLLYFGTPTLVDGRKLFPECDAEQWDKEKEREVARRICLHASTHEATRIVSGLGSGDISLRERIEDMTLPGWSPPAVVVVKRFEGFTDWLLITDRN